MLEKFALLAKDFWRWILKILPVYIKSESENLSSISATKRRLAIAPFCEFVPILSFRFMIFTRQPFSTVNMKPFTHSYL